MSGLVAGYASASDSDSERDTASGFQHVSLPSDAHVHPEKHEMNGERTHRGNLSPKRQPSGYTSPVVVQEQHLDSHKLPEERAGGEVASKPDLGAIFDVPFAYSRGDDEPLSAAVVYRSSIADPPSETAQTADARDSGHSLGTGADQHPMSSDISLERSDDVASDGEGADEAFNEAEDARELDVQRELRAKTAELRQRLELRGARGVGKASRERIRRRARRSVSARFVRRLEKEAD